MVKYKITVFLVCWSTWITRLISSSAAHKLKTAMNFQRSTAFEVATTPNAQCWLVQNVCVFVVRQYRYVRLKCVGIGDRECVARNKCTRIHPQRERKLHTEIRWNHTGRRGFGSLCTAHNRPSDDANEAKRIACRIDIIRQRFDVFGGKNMYNELRNRIRINMETQLHVQLDSFVRM